MSKLLFVAVATVTFALSNLSAQRPEQKSRVILFHVTSVQRVDDSSGCKASECSVVKYRVEGYAEGDQENASTSYVLSCDELFYERPHPHRNNICARFHAGSAYTAQLMSDSISFPTSGLNKAFETDYSIVSEKEMPASLNPQGASGNTEPREATKSPEPPRPAKGPEQIASRVTTH